MNPNPNPNLFLSRILPVIGTAFLLIACHAALDRVEQGLSPEERAERFSIHEIDILPAERGLHVDHYPASNERRIDLFYEHIKGLGGGYIGVGTDQNLTFVAWARSEYAWLMDFDAVVVDVNRIHLFFISQAPTVADFRDFWDPANRETSLSLVLENFPADEHEKLRYAFGIAHRGWSGVPSRLQELDLMERRFNLSTFTNNPDDYEYLRTMVAEGRIQAVGGDLNGTVTMQNIARSARALDIPIRLLYTSNAEEYFRYPPEFRDNIRALPGDEASLVVRTATSGAPRFGFPEGEKFPDDFPFHYNLQSLDNFKKWMNYDGHLSIVRMLNNRTDLQRGLSRMEKTPAESNL